MTNFEQLVEVLVSGEVDFILVGGMAGIVHGSSRLTQDLDIVYSRNGDALTKLIDALAPFSPYPRGAPPGLPFRWDDATLARGLNFTLTTTIGDVDLLGEISGGGRYDDLIESTIEVSLFGFPVTVIGLEKLIDVKRAAGRPKDFEAIAELELLLEERSRRSE